MTTPSNPDVIPDTGFDPIVFWLEHKKQIIIYAAILIVAAGAFAFYQVTAQRKIAEAEQLFAQASTEDDYRQVAQKYPHTVVAGNATLLLAEKLRDAKKYDEATAVLHGLIDNYADYPMVDAAWLSLAATLEAQGKPDEALSTYQQIVTTFPSRSSAPQAMLAQAEILKIKGKTDDARRTYENVKSQFPDSFYGAEAMQELQQLKK